MSTAFSVPDTFVAKDFKRDRWDRPYIMQPNGKRIGYTRCSSAAKAIEDTYNLTRWDNRNISFGMAHDASLVARILAIGGDPSTWGKPEKNDVNEIVEAARGVAKAHKRADIGTAIHHLTHRVDRGEDVKGGPYQADLDAYVAAMVAAGLRCHPEWIECRIVNDILQMAGTADRIVITGAGVHRIADIKTGATIEFGGLGWTAQGAAYAGGVLYDIDEEYRRPTPPIDQSIGYIIHLPAGEGRCDIYEMDLRGGLRAAVLANEIRAIRKESKAWITPIKIAPAATDPPGSAVERPAPEPAPPAGSGAETNALEALRQRYRAMSEKEQDDVRATLVVEGTDAEDAAAVEAILNRFDTFNQSVAEAPPQTHSKPAAPRPHPPDEGADVDKADVEALKKRFAKMTPAAKAWAGAVPVQSNAGHCWRINEKATVRRYELYRGVFALTEWAWTPSSIGEPVPDQLDDIVRAIVHQLTGEDAALFPTTTPGVALGLLDAGLAVCFARLVDDLTNDRLDVVYDADGRCRLEPVT